MAPLHARWWAALAAVALVLLSGSPAVSEDFPDHIDEIVLRDVMWQDLPQQVRAVFVDPTDRLWFQLCHPAAKEDLAKVVGNIRREFSKPAPQLFGASPCLFEPDGRVWFVTQTRSVLIGYDGREFLERHADQKHFFTGNCPNHGRNYRAGYNLFAAGTAFFLESQGVLTFSGGRWAYQQMTESARSRGMALYLEQDGRGVTAWVRDGKTSSVWRWRDGTWRETPLPATVDPASVQAVAPWQDGIWLFTEGGPVYHSYRDETPDDFEQLIEKLGDDSYQVREGATRELMKRGPAILEPATKAREQSDDLEVRTRLKRVIDAARQNAQRAVRFGPYQLGGAQFAFYDTDATVYLTAANIFQGDRWLGSGLVVGRRDGTVRAFIGSCFPQRWGSHYSEESGPLVLEPGKRVWLPMCAGGIGPGLLEIDKKEITQAMPDLRMRWLHAVKSDGTVFAGLREPTQPWGRPVMAFRPFAPDDRNILTAQRIEIPSSGDVCVATDGRVWVETDDRGLVRFDGRRWDEVKGADLRDIRALLPGDRGSMIVVTRDSCALIDDDVVVQRGSVKELIADCQEAVARLFASGADAAWLSIVPDGRGNIWVRDTRKLSVLTDGRWIDAAVALKGVSRTGEVEYVGRCAGGGRVYVTDFMLTHDRGSSHFGEVKDGKVVFTEAPHTCESYFMHLDVHDDEGALWVPGSIRGSGGTCDWIRGQLALRMAEEGVVEKLTNSGWAKLNDAGGNVWLGRIRGRDESVLNIWRDGRIVHTVTVPGAYAQSAMFSDRPGSVYVWTRLGLRHLVADDPDRPGAYSLGKLYAIDGFEGNPMATRFSRLGFLAVSIYTDRLGPRKHYLYLIRLPAG